MKEQAGCGLKKNDLFELKIEDIGSEGEGIGRYDGFTFFVKDATAGDVITARVLKLKKNYGFARVEKILTPSPDRVTPRCPVAKQCGGCQLQHLSYEKQLEYKHNKVKNCLERIGGIENPVMEPILGMTEPYYYRNKAQFPVGVGKDGKPVIGFYAGRTHSIIDTEHCYIQARVNECLMAAVREFLTEYQIAPYEEESGTGLVRHILTRVGFTTGEIMVCPVLNGDKLPHAEALLAKLQKAVEEYNQKTALQVAEIAGERKEPIFKLQSLCFNVNKERTNVILGTKIIPYYGETYITDYIGEVKYQISPLSFYQVNPSQTRVLYEQALAYADLAGGEIVWDLYCGIGTISLFLAAKAKQVYGVEIVPEAIADAKKNAALNGISNAEFFVGAAEDVLPAQYEKSGGTMRADVIVVDPPRKGCEESLLATIVAMQPKRVVYVSCDSATLARDVKYLGEHGYEYVKARVVDQFGQSGHCETVCLLVRKASR
ncbi:MAG: 23S rRNA (uracil(1939)-C(5))-methyltransferase RlmD [Lachnospiraceae bacterium]|nr:23S rRNA (uracil(1939)-C(5))-methyltransferase RlmD [Lachnospiraceae bacterium]